MAEPNAAAITNNSKTAKAVPNRPLVPPDERFWQRYSPHYELPISGIGSLMDHVLGSVALLVAGFLFAQWLKPNDPVPVDIVEFESGGGGDPNGAGNGPGDGARVEDLPKDPQAKPPENQPENPPTDLPKVIKDDSLTVPELPTDPAGTRAIEDSAKELARLSGLQEAATKKLMGSLAGKGEGGTGSGGGKGKGKGTGQGDGSGPGKGGGKTSRRQQRVLRWTMIFDVRDGSEYLRQLDALGAIIGMPESDGKIRVVHDLKNEVKNGDVYALKRIFWWDTKEESVRGLAAALRLNPAPTQIVAFFPIDLEEKLLRMELSYMQRRKGRQNEDEIKETQFHVERRGSTYAPVVVDQSYELRR